MGIIALLSLRVSAVGDNVYQIHEEKAILFGAPFQKGWADIPALKNKQLWFCFLSAIYDLVSYFSESLSNKDTQFHDD